MKQTLAQLSASLCADLIGEDCTFSKVSINTRTLETGDLFVAIKGDNFDAHEYIKQAEEKGACALVVEKICSSVLPQIVVANTRTALGDIASFWRSAFSLPIVAITGSCGKTTVKEMSAAIFREKFSDASQSVSKKRELVLATKGNLNNDIGVPLTLLRLTTDHKAAVIELGANHLGEIKQLVDRVQPNVALITNVTHAHVEGFGSIEGIAKGKAEIFTGLDSNGTAVINADDQFADYWLDCYQQQLSQNGNIKKLTFGLDKSADISADYKQLKDGLEIFIKTPEGKQVVLLKQFGIHNVYNALAATALTLSSGCSLEDIKAGLENFSNVSGRLEQKQGHHGSMIFDDTYNANPGSVRAGIEAIKQVEGDTILILGDMAELGEESAQLHYQLGIDAAQMGIRQLFTVGKMSQETANGYNSVVLNGDENIKKIAAIHFLDKSELVHKIKSKLNNHSVVLIKGSRSMAMESVVNSMVDKSINSSLQADNQIEGDR